MWLVECYCVVCFGVVVELLVFCWWCFWVVCFVCWWCWFGVLGLGWYGFVW